MASNARGGLPAAAVTALGLLAACSSGGSDGPAPLAIGFENATSSGAEGTVLQVGLILTSTIGTLTEDKTVTVRDMGTGSSAAGADHDFVGDVVVTFPAGSDQGAIQIMDVSLASDLSIEGGDETLALTLVDASPGVATGSLRNHTLTLEETDFAEVSFLSTGSATVDENTPLSIEAELQLDPGETLDVDVQVTVQDDGSGTATSGADYMPFAPQVLTFPAGSADGSRLTVILQPIGDTAIEGDETTLLVFAGPSPGTQLGTASHMVTITDDDLSGAPFLVVNGALMGGPVGPVADDDSFDLGPQPLGGGPNGALELLIQNAGAQSFDLAPLVIAGDTRDFSVSLNDTGAAPLPLAGSAAFPLALLEEDAVYGARMELDPGLCAVLEASERAIVDGVVLPGGGEVTLVLERLVLPFADDVLVLVDGQAVPVDELVGDLSVWSGSVPDLEGSSAFLAFSSAGSHGWVRLGDDLGTVHLVTEYGSGEPVVHWLWDAQLEGAYTGPPPATCQGALLPPWAALDPVDPGDPPAAELPVGLTLAECRLAIETDFQFFSRFGDAGAATQYATQLVAAVADVYERDVQTTLSIAYLGIHTNANDGWTTQESGGSPGDLLDEFQTAWAGNWPAQADLAHFISGAGLGGGVAYVGVLCNQSFGFGVSASINGNIDWGTFTGAPSGANWDFVVVAHELGHNFGALHTHDYCPPLDQCYSNCNGTTSCTQGTLMSYCHTCGGLANLRLDFHPHVAEQMRSDVASSCIADSTLGPGTTISLTVSFEPTSSTGAKAATLRLSHTAPNEPTPFRMNLSGIATN